MGVLLIDATAVYDPRLVDDRLILGMKGTISEMEVANFRARGQAALQQKAARGELVQRVAIGYVKGPDDRIEKSPDARIRWPLNWCLANSLNWAASDKFSFCLTGKGFNCRLLSAVKAQVK